MKIYLALEGGGARGSYQVGAIKALIENGYEIEAVVGTSIGAINGAFVAMNSIDLMESTWRESVLADFISGDRDVLNSINKHKLHPGLLDFLVSTVQQGGLDIGPLRRQLHDLIDEEKLRSSGIKFGLTIGRLKGLDLKPMQVFVEDIPRGDLIDYIVASANLPVFQPIKRGAEYWIDGGFCDNLPFSMLEDLDPKFPIFAIRLNALGLVKEPSPELNKRMTYIQPSDKLGTFLSARKELTSKNIKLGYLDALRAIGRTCGKNYYISDTPVEFHLPQLAASLLAEAMGAAPNIDPQTLYGLLSELLDEEIKTPMQAYTAVLERVAAVIQLERLHVYSFEEFERTIRDRIVLKLDKQDGPTITDILGIPVVLSKISKKETDRIVLEIYSVLSDVYKIKGK